ncbi:MAG TPA: SMP-30/gluconolactonase/LRE family protein [Chryseolinea sp.]|nr:SMP-30/gluconolactonase/LRE family protein [Chryseolinea sp.]HPH46406.1 SMP-30/gluconolactonase/LRE family protein [Chryseolinea sp.]HPM32584.1 SMP-30/gluconolactonase/LRE family protein [Chryseolinea sp.]
MKKNELLLSLGIVLCSLGFSSCSDDPETKGLIEADAQLVNLGSGYSFTEGPAVDKNGNVFFTDQPNDKIFKWNAVSGDITPFLSETGRSNGMAFDKEGNLITCADMYGEVWKIAPDGSHTVLVDNYNGKMLNGPNDVWINPVTGGMYITDPIFPRGYWDDEDPRKQGWPPTHSEQAEEGKGGHVYYLAPGATELVRVTTQGDWDADAWPNGVVGTPDGKKLYVNKWAGDNMGGTWVFDINADGTLTNLKKFIDMGGDGMSMDEKRNIYISNGLGVNVFDKNGNELVTIFTGGGATNNVFAGQDNKTLFITGPVDKVNSLKMNVKGVEKF